VVREHRPGSANYEAEARGRRAPRLTTMRTVFAAPRRPSPRRGVHARCQLQLQGAPGLCGSQAPVPRGGLRFGDPTLKRHSARLAVSRLVAHGCGRGRRRRHVWVLGSDLGQFRDRWRDACEGKHAETASAGRTARRAVEELIHEINERITNGVVIKKIGVVINGIEIVINGIGFVIRFIIASCWSGVQHGRHRARRERRGRR
jgi:hypothetical protein